MSETLYSKHTNGCNVSNIEIDENKTLDSVKIDFNFMGKLFKRFIISVVYDDMLENNTGADFSNLKLIEEKIKKQSCNSFDIKAVDGIGIIMIFEREKILIPLYDMTTGYYDNNVEMEVKYQKYENGIDIVEEEIEKFNPRKFIKRLT